MLIDFFSLPIRHAFQALFKFTVPGFQRIPLTGTARKAFLKSRYLYFLIANSFPVNFTITRQLGQLYCQVIPLFSRFSCRNRVSLSLMVKALGYLLKALKPLRQGLTRIK